MSIANFEDILTWAKEARCKNKPQEWWYPENFNSVTSRRDVARAKTQCNLCPVKEQCLEYALAHQEEHGVWGGLTPTERGNSRSLRNRLRLANKL